MYLPVAEHCVATLDRAAAPRAAGRASTHPVAGADPTAGPAPQSRLAAAEACRGCWDNMAAIAAAVRLEHPQAGAAEDCRRSTRIAQMPAAPQAVRRTQTTRIGGCDAPSRSDYGLGPRELAAPG